MFTKISRYLVISLAVMALAAGCATSSGKEHAYKLYPGPQRPVAELATLDISGVDSVTIDKLHVKRWDYETVLVLPGRHEVVTGKGFGFSVMVEQRLQGERWQIPSRVYARPLTLRPHPRAIRVGPAACARLAR